MPRILRTQRRISPNPAMLRTISPGGFDAPARAAAGLGKQIASLGSSLAKEQDELDQFDMSKKLTEFSLQQRQAQYDADNSIQGDGRDHVASSMQRYQQDASKVMQSIPQSKRKRAELAILQMQTGFQGKAQQAEQRHQSSYFEAEAGKQITNVVLPNLSGNLDQFRQRLSMVDTMVANTPRISQSQRVRLQAQAAKAAAEKWAEGVHPTDGLEQLDALKKEKSAPIAAPVRINNIRKQNLQGMRTRRGKVQGVVVHHTAGGSLSGAIEHGNKTRTGTQYYIDRDGTIHQFADDNVKMNHMRSHGDRYRTDKGKYKHLNNDTALGIEVVARNAKDVTPEQQSALNGLLGHLSQKHGIKKGNILGHGELQGGAGGNKQHDEGVSGAVAYRNGTPVGPATTGDYLKRELVLNADKYERQFNRQLAEMHKIEEQQFEQAMEIREKEGIDLLAENKLTREWVSKHSEELSKAAYQRFLRVTTPGYGARTNPETYVDLLERAKDDPEEVRREAIEAYSQGRLNQSAFNKIYSETKGENKYPRVIEELRSELKRALRPKSRDEEGSKAYIKSIQELDDYIDGVIKEGGEPKAMRQQIQEKVKQMIESETPNSVMRSRAKLELPRFGQVSRENMDDETLTSIMQRTKQALDAKKITQDEFETELVILKRWYDLLKQEANGK